MVGIQESSVGMVRNYRPSDFESVKRIHDQTQIDYQFPDLNSPLFVVTKIYEDSEGVIRAAGGLYVQLEAYLWLDKSGWASPQEKLDVIEALQMAAFTDQKIAGIECAVLWLPPGMEKFGDRLINDLGWSRDRDGWISFSRNINA
jgi:hypothetical protein